YIELCMLSKQDDVARVEPLGLIEIRLAPVPLASPSRDRGQRCRNLAAIGQESLCLLEVTDRGVVIPKTCVVIVSFGQYRLAEIGLKSESGFGCLPRLFAQGGCRLKNRCDVATRIYV